MTLPFLFYALLVVLCVLTTYFLAQAIYPTLTWMLKRWQYRNPDQVQPSKWIFLVRRIRALVLMSVLMALTLKLFLSRETILGALSVTEILL